MTIQIMPEANEVWHLRSTISKKAVKSLDKKFFIKPFNIDKTYTSEFVAVGVRVKNSKNNWRNGGYLSQEFLFPALGYNNNGKAFNQSKNLLINNVSILNFPAITSSPYRLRYFPPTYFVDVTIQIWEYVGTTTNILVRELANFLHNSSPELLINLEDVNNKLNLILANQQSTSN